MKQLKSVFLIWLVVFFGLSLLVTMLADSWLGTPPDWWEAVLTSALNALIYSGGMVGVAYTFIGSRMKFLGSAERDLPPFGWKVTTTVPVETAEFSFEVVKYRIREQHYLITYYDDVDQYLVKFRTPFTLRSWGAGGTATYDPVARTITIACFSMTAFSEKETRVAQTTLDKVASLVRGK